MAHNRSPNPPSTATAPETGGSAGEHSGVPKGRFVRGSILGGAVARASAKKARLAASQPFRSAEQRIVAAEKTDAEVAELLFNALGVLKGTALKVAQVLATEVELVPESLRQELSRATHRAPPLNRALVNRTLRAELGSLEEHFSQISLTPFAAASLGQVHAAIGQSGRKLAVKVQYPNVADGIRSDVALMRAALSPTRYSKVFASSLREIEARLAEELDYAIEAKNTAWFRNNIDVPGVVLPEVDSKASSRHILTTTHLEGQHLDEWMQRNPSQSQRDHYGQLLVDLFHHSALELGQIHADPNSGNYLFRDDGQLGVIDFGCVKKIAPAVARGILQLSQEEAHDPEIIEATHHAMGVRYRQDLPRPQLLDFLARWGSWITKPYGSEVFDFGRGQDYFDEGAILGRELHRYLDGYDGTFVYFGRTHHGLLRLLQRLGARVRLTPSLSQ